MKRLNFSFPTYFTLNFILAYKFCASFCHIYMQGIKIYVNHKEMKDIKKAQTGFLIKNKT